MSLFIKNAAVSLGIGLIKLVALLPLPMARALGTGIGRLLWITNSGTAKVTKINLGICFPELSEDERRAMAKKSLIAQGQTYTEMGVSWEWPIPKVQKLITETTGMEYLQQALDDKQGLIIAVPHLGNWEILSHYLRQYLFMTAMYKSAKIPVLDNYIFKTRKRVDVDLVPAGRAGVEALYRTLNDKGVVAVLPDQEPGKKSGVFVPFFGQNALTSKLVGELASNHPDVPVLCCYAKRLEGGGYSVTIRPAREEVRSSDPVISATALNHDVEDCIRDCPEQYQWGYKRFRRQPKGRSLIYK